MRGADILSNEHRQLVGKLASTHTYQERGEKMTIRSMVFTFVALMVVLTFSTPLTTLAQQESVQTEISEPVAAQDANAVILEAKAAAEQDVSNDINNLLWFSVGLGIAYAGGGVGGIAGGIIDDGLGLSESGGEVGFVVGAAAGVLASIIAIYKSPVRVPAGRLTGKSPEYVEFYIQAYQSKMRSLQTGGAAVGAAIGCGVPIIGCLITNSQ